MQRLQRLHSPHSQTPEKAAAEGCSELDTSYMIKVFTTHGHAWLHPSDELFPFVKRYSLALRNLKVLPESWQRMSMYCRISKYLAAPSLACRACKQIPNHIWKLVDPVPITEETWALRQCIKAPVPDSRSKEAHDGQIGNCHVVRRFCCILDEGNRGS